MKTETAKFAHLQYIVLHELEISIPEYWYLDMVYQLSRNGWCNKRLDSIAEDMRMSRMGVIKLRDRLIEKQLIIKGVGNRVRTGDKVNKVYFLDESQRKSTLSYKKVNKVYSKSKQSFPKNNNRITKDIKGSLKEKLRTNNPKLFTKLYG